MILSVVLCNLRNSLVVHAAYLSIFFLSFGRLALGNISIYKFYCSFCSRVRVSGIYNNRAKNYYFNIKKDSYVILILII